MKCICFNCKIEFEGKGPGISIACENPECRARASKAFHSLMKRTKPICMGCGKDYTKRHRCNGL